MSAIKLICLTAGGDQDSWFHLPTSHHLNPRTDCAVLIDRIYYLAMVTSNEAVWALNEPINPIHPIHAVALLEGEGRLDDYLYFEGTSLPFGTKPCKVQTFEGNQWIIFPGSGKSFDVAYQVTNGRCDKDTRRLVYTLTKASSAEVAAAKAAADQAGPRRRLGRSGSSPRVQARA